MKTKKQWRKIKSVIEMLMWNHFYTVVCNAVSHNEWQTQKPTYPWHWGVYKFMSSETWVSSVFEERECFVRASQRFLDILKDSPDRNFIRIIEYLSAFRQLSVILPLFSTVLSIISTILHVSVILLFYAAILQCGNWNLMNEFSV